LIGGEDIEKQEKEQDETKKMVSELDTDKLKEITEPMTGLIGKIKEALQGKKEIDEPSEEEIKEYENGYQQYLEDNKLKDTVENKAEYTMSLEQNNSEFTAGPTENSSNAGTTTTTSKKVSGRVDTETGKTYINEKEVSADEYNVFANMSMEEKVQKYGQTEGLSTSVNTSDNITPQKDKNSSDNLKYNSNVNEGKQVIVMTKTKEKTKIVPVTVAV
jgi:soluble cytochrome b562